VTPSVEATGLTDDTGPPDDAGCTLLHVDMDAFFAAVELLSRPELVGRPVIVGGQGRGVVLSATYEARRYGVRSAMPVAHARRLCPRAVVLAPHRSRYEEVSAGVMEIFRSITPVVEPLSLDEAFLDVSGSVRRLGSPTNIGARIRRAVYAQQGITCSVGVASVKFVAKIASARCKPDGLLVVPQAGVLPFLRPLPVGALWGVGARTEQQLARRGVHTVGELADLPLTSLTAAMGMAAAAHLHALAWGRDPRQVTSEVREKSIGAEETFDRDVDNPETVRRELLRLSERVAARLRSSGLVGPTICLKIRLGDFTTRTRSRTVDRPTDSGNDIYETVVGLYETMGLERARLRLVGVRVERLITGDSQPRQLLLGERVHGWSQADRAIDSAAQRYGYGAVRRARLLGGEACDKADESDSSPP
jgi:DNA polymerase IV